MSMHARITASVYTSHVPAIGVAMDQGRTQDPYWSPLFAGYAPSRRWMDANRPDAIVLVYNDHANAFSLDIIPTFALGTADRYEPADEGWGPRAVPPVHGHGELAHQHARPVLHLHLASRERTHHQRRRLSTGITAAGNEKG